MKHKKSVLIYDTTLRDGNQAVGINLSLSDKLRIAERLSDLGFHYIEGGWPNPTNETDKEFYKRIAQKKLKAQNSCFRLHAQAGNPLFEGRPSSSRW